LDKSFNWAAYLEKIRKFNELNGRSSNGDTISFEYRDGTNVQRIYTFQNGSWSDAQHIEDGNITTRNSNYGK
jgi:hypothetical protein